MSVYGSGGSWVKDVHESIFCGGNMTPAFILYFLLNLRCFFFVRPTQILLQTKTLIEATAVETAEILPDEDEVKAMYDSKNAELFSIDFTDNLKG